jgi:hypothetical protein
MTSHRASVLVAAGLLAFSATGVITATTSTASTPSSTGCPAGSGFEVLSLTFLASQGGYQQPFSLDAAGNNDGLVCGKPLPIVVLERACPTCPVPVLYTFIENDLTPAK